MGYFGIRCLLLLLEENYAFIVICGIENTSRFISWRSLVEDVLCVDVVESRLGRGGRGLGYSMAVSVLALVYRIVCLSFKFFIIYL